MMPHWLVRLIEYLPHAGAFVAGVAATLLAQYFGDWLTDKRRKRESRTESQTSFEAIRRKMPELIAEMKNDLSNPKSAKYRNVLVFGVGEYAGMLSPQLLYYRAENYPTLISDFVLLENEGYVQDVTEPGKGLRMYRLTEEFVRLVLAS